MNEPHASPDRDPDADLSRVDELIEERIVDQQVAAAVEAGGTPVDADEVVGPNSA